MEMNIIQLYKFMKLHCTNSPFLGVFARDRVPLQPKYPSGIILNTDKQTEEGEHWLAIYYDNDGYAEFFDSFGKHPSYYNMEAYMNKTSRKWNHNTIQLQSFSNFCGHYCLKNTKKKDDIIAELIRRGIFVWMNKMFCLYGVYPKVIFIMVWITKTYLWNRNTTQQETHAV